MEPEWQQGQLVASSHGRRLLAVVCLRVHAWQFLLRRRGSGDGGGELWSGAATSAAFATAAATTAAFATAAVATLTAAVAATIAAAAAAVAATTVAATITLAGTAATITTAVPAATVVATITTPVTASAFPAAAVAAACPTPAVAAAAAALTARSATSTFFAAAATLTARWATSALAAATLQRATGWPSPLSAASGPCGTGRLCHPPAAQLPALGRWITATDRVPWHPAQCQVVACIRALSACRPGKPRGSHGQTTIWCTPPVQRNRVLRVVCGQRRLPR